MKKNNNDRHLLRMIFVGILVVAIILMYCLAGLGIAFGADRNGIELAATGAAIYVGESNSYLWDYQGDKQYDPASTTKLLTCLIAAEQLNMDDKVKVTQEALEVTDTALYLEKGEKIKVYDLMALALLESHNEAAKMLAIAVSGSEKEFAKLMNQRAKQIGCTNCKFKNSTGLRNPRNYASAKDLCLITEEAMKNDIVREICSKSKYTIAATNKHEKKKLTSTNLFLKGGTFTNLSGDEVKVKKISEVYGGKTGTTVKMKATMCVACEVNGINVYITILNSTIASRYKDIATLVEYVRNNVQPYTALEKGTVFDKKARVKEGAVKYVTGEAAEDGVINLPEGASASLVMVDTVFNEEITAPVYQGDVIGEAVIYLADEKVSSVDIIATRDVEKGWFLSKIGLTNTQTIIIISVLSLVIIMFIVISTLRSINKSKAKKRRQEKIKEMALKQIDREKDASDRNWPYH